MCAFPEGERKLVSTLASNLLAEKTTPQTMSLVAETDGDVVGHVAFSPVIIDHQENLLGYILAPLGVKPDYQRCRIGSSLVEKGMQQLSVMGVNLVFVYGDPHYYSRFGFSAETARHYITPYPIQYPFGWQAMVLNDFDSGKSPAAVTCVTSLCDPTLW